VPIIVAVNKIDRPEANPMRVRQQLAGYNLNAEEWGGETGFVDLSALTGEGVDSLLERIVLEAELLELKANPDRPASGAVLEARMEPGRGAVTNIVVQRGTLRVGDVLVCGNAYGTVRAMMTQHGDQVREAGPSQPVALSGLNQSPEAGDTFVVVGDLETARKVAEERDLRVQQLRRKPLQRVTLETLFDRLERGEMKQFNVVLKADVQGSLEPLMDSLGRLGDEEVSVRVIHNGIGNINPSDVVLADAADAVIIAFRVTADEKVRDMASTRGIEIIYYDVIYNVTDQIHAALEGLLEPERREERVGLAEVRRVFRISRYGAIAGCYVLEGAIRRNCRVRVLRDGEVLHDGAISSLRQEKSDVREVEAGRECGINVEGFDAIQEGDRIEAYQTVTVKRTLSRRSSRETSPQQSGAGTS
jgi:translation initiation factor IF-2